MSKEATDKALAALKRMKSYGDIFRHRHNEKNPYEQVCEAIVALEAIAEQPAPEAGLSASEPEVIKACGHRKYSFDRDDLGCLSCWAIEEMRRLEVNRPPAAPQPAQQQESVASLLVGQDSDGRYVSIAAKAHADTLPLGEYKLYTSPPAQRKPLTDGVNAKLLAALQNILECDDEDHIPGDLVAEAKEAIESAQQPAQQAPVECQYGKCGYACCEGGPCKADEQNNAAQRTWVG